MSNLDEIIILAGRILAILTIIAVVGVFLVVPFLPKDKQE